MLCRRATRFLLFGRPPSFPLAIAAADFAEVLALPPLRPMLARYCVTLFIGRTIQTQRRCSRCAMRRVVPFLWRMGSLGLYPTRTAPPRSRAMRRGPLRLVYSFGPNPFGVTSTTEKPKLFCFRLFFAADSQRWGGRLVAGVCFLSISISFLISSFVQFVFMV